MNLQIAQMSLQDLNSVTSQKNVDNPAEIAEKLDGDDDLPLETEDCRIPE